jgi:hypothetical protein
MEKREPYTTEKEFSKCVVPYKTVLLVKLGHVQKAHIVSCKKITVIFMTLDPQFPHSRSPP